MCIRDRGNDAVSITKASDESPTSADLQLRGKVRRSGFSGDSLVQIRVQLGAISQSPFMANHRLRGKAQFAEEFA